MGLTTENTEGTEVLFTICDLSIYDCVRSWCGDAALGVARCTASASRPASRDGEGVVATSASHYHLPIYQLPTTQRLKRKGFRFSIAKPHPTLNLQRTTHTPQRTTLNLQHSTLNTQRSTLNAQHSITCTHGAYALRCHQRGVRPQAPPMRRRTQPSSLSRGCPPRPPPHACDDHRPLPRRSFRTC